MLILLLGGSLSLDAWRWRVVGFALILFTIAQSLRAVASLLGIRTPWRILGRAGWFGVCGIGSLCCLIYAIQHGLPEDLAVELIQLTLVVVTLSIVVHGISVKPMMSRFWRRRVDV